LGWFRGGAGQRQLFLSGDETRESDEDSGWSDCGRGVKEIEAQGGGFRVDEKRGSSQRDTRPTVAPGNPNDIEMYRETAADGRGVSRGESILLVTMMDLTRLL